MIRWRFLERKFRRYETAEEFQARYIKIKDEEKKLHELKQEIKERQRQLQKEKEKGDRGVGLHAPKSPQ